MARVLIIEDNASVRGVACRVLRSAGYETVEAEHGKAGVEVFKRDRPDLVITDIFMPEQEGLETIRQVRAIDPLLPIIVISGVSHWGGSSPLEEAMALGANVILEKPFPIGELVAAADRLLHTARET